MTDSPKVSAVIATYNRADLLPRAVRSVLSQTYQDHELIIVDDCSTDKTREVVSAWTDSRILYVRHQENRHQSGAINTGIEHARGEYMAFLDDDDEWVPTKLEKQVGVFESSGPGVGLVYGWVDEVDDSTGRTRTKYRGTMSGDLSEDLLGLKIPGPTTTLMVRTQIARDAHGFDESLTAYNDLDFLIRVSQMCEIAALPKVVAVQHVGHGHGRMNIDSESVLVKKVDYIRRHMRRYSTRLSGSPGASARVYLHLARNEMLLGNTLSGLSALCLAVKLDPVHICHLIATRGVSEMVGFAGRRVGR